MKLVIAIIQPHKLDDVMRELDKQEIHLKTVTNVLGCGRQKGVTEVYRGVKEAGTLLKKVRLEIGVNDAYVQPTVDAIIKGARTGNIGDGKIFVLPMEECIRIRSGEKGKWQSGRRTGLRADLPDHSVPMSGVARSVRPDQRGSIQCSPINAGRSVSVRNQPKEVARCLLRAFRFLARDPEPRPKLTHENPCGKEGGEELHGELLMQVPVLRRPEDVREVRVDEAR